MARTRNRAPSAAARAAAAADRPQAVRAVQSRPIVGRPGAATVSAFHISQSVRLIEPERAKQRDIGDTPGRVHNVADGDGSVRAVEVLWLTSPMFRAWHKASELEPSP
jgi:hypothetical protein